MHNLHCLKSKQWIAYCAQCLIMYFYIHAQVYFTYVYIFCRLTTRWKEYIYKKIPQVSLLFAITLAALLSTWSVNRQLMRKWPTQYELHMFIASFIKIPIPSKQSGHAYSPWPQRLETVVYESGTQRAGPMIDIPFPPITDSDLIINQLDRDRRWDIMEFLHAFLLWFLWIELRWYYLKD